MAFDEEPEVGEEEEESVDARGDFPDFTTLEEIERYFFTSSATLTTTTTGTGTTAATTAASTWKCWHCDEGSLTACFANGKEKECHRGDYGSCMLEVTEQYGGMRNICMGCKQAEACEAAKAENFWDFLPTAVAA